MNLAIIGGGPAGLYAAEIARKGGCKVILFEGKASVGRKFLVAGHGGLNLTHSEAIEPFSKRYSGGASTSFWTSLLSDFSNNDLSSWANQLGIETFIGTSGRIFPKEFKAAPLLRRWVEYLRVLGVQFKTRHQLKEIKRVEGRFLLEFTTPKGSESYDFDALLLALGGASWPKTGSDAKWISLFEKLGIKTIPFQAANCGWETDWSEEILRHAEGHPLKNILVKAGERSISGELLITRYGLEGGALYQLGSILRSMTPPFLTLDLKPSFSVHELAEKIKGFSGNFLFQAVRSWRLGVAAASLLRSLSPETTQKDPLSLAQFAKAVPIRLSRPRPIAEAISSAGGVAFSELDENLMVRRLPGLFVAGEMIDWEAPTGGYLLQGCFATANRAAKGALKYRSASS